MVLVLLKLAHLGICHIFVNNCRNFLCRCGGLQWYNIHTKFSENLSFSSVVEIEIHTNTHQYNAHNSLLCFSVQIRKSMKYYLYEVITTWVGEGAWKKCVNLVTSFIMCPLYQEYYFDEM